MIHVDIKEEVRLIPDLLFTLIEVEQLLGSYRNRSDLLLAEEKATLAAQSTCKGSTSWRDIPESEYYAKFYKLTGVQGKHYSTPFKQAFRFTSKPYQSISPIIDASMIAEYATGISFQIFNKPKSGVVTINRAKLDTAGTKANSTSWGEICLYDKDKLIHSPTLGLQKGFFLMPSDKTAVIRLMKIPGLSINSFEQAKSIFCQELEAQGAAWKMVTSQNGAQIPTAASKTSSHQTAKPKPLM